MTKTKRFDPTTRNLVDMGPAGWHAYLGQPVSDPGRITVIDSNLSTVTADADRVLNIADPVPWLHLIELQAGRDVWLESRLHLYSTVLHFRHHLPVRTSLVLLREAADGPELDGYLELRHPDDEIYDGFRYNVVRVWEQPVEQILAAGLTVLPLAPVSRVKKAQVPEVLVAISERLERETTPELAQALWNATTILMGLRYENEEIDGMIRGVYKMLFGIRGIEESSVYQNIFQKGAVEEARKILIRHGTKKFGPPGEQAMEQIAALGDLDRLHDLVDGVLDVGTWDELLGSPN